MTTLVERLRSGGPYDFLVKEAVADRIEQQQSWIESLEQNARDADRLYAELETELAASQAQIKVLREALIHLTHNAKKSGANMGLALDISAKALNQPTDDNALQAAIAAEREACAKVAATYDATPWNHCHVSTHAADMVSVAIATAIRARSTK